MTFHFHPIRTTHMAAIPSPFPIMPSPSAVVALTLTIRACTIKAMGNLFRHGFPVWRYFRLLGKHRDIDVVYGNIFYL
jgi:hypothetical protein